LGGAEYVSGEECTVPETKVAQLSGISAATGLPASWANPIKPELFAGKHEVQLGKAVGISQFGVNHVTLEPGSISSLRHWHEAEDELVFVLSGEITLVDDNGRCRLGPGSVVGFPAGVPNAHHLINDSSRSATFLAIGSRRPGEETIHYPDDSIGPVRK
jgi:uncharacterized cupin superfamily protein